MPDEGQSRPFIRRAWETGINFFDTPTCTPTAGPRPRAPRPRHPARAGRDRYEIDNRLKRLQFDYVDLYQIHRFDPTTPVEETLAARDAVVRAGKVLHIGTSSMFAWQNANTLLQSANRLTRRELAPGIIGAKGGSEGER